MRSLRSKGLLMLAAITAASHIGVPRPLLLQLNVPFSADQYKTGASNTAVSIRPERLIWTKMR